jgi:hypothetical protein
VLERAHDRPLAAKPAFIRQIIARDLTLALDQCLADADQDDVQVIRLDGEARVLVPIERSTERGQSVRPPPPRQGLRPALGAGQAPHGPLPQACEGGQAGHARAVDRSTAGGARCAMISP